MSQSDVIFSQRHIVSYFEVIKIKTNKPGNPIVTKLQFTTVTYPCVANMCLELVHSCIWNRHIFEHSFQLRRKLTTTFCL